MPISFDAQYDGAVLRVTTRGEGSKIDEVMQYGAAVAKQCHKYETNLLLVDERDLQHLLEIPDTYELAKYYASLGVISLRAAVIWKADEISDHDAVFFEAATGNRGIHLQIFDTHEAAEDWLLFKK